MKTKIILLTTVLFLTANFTSIVSAADPFVYVSPSSLTKTVGGNFNVSIGVKTSGNKVCAVEGTLVFNNLSCKSVTIAKSVTPQSSPTCSSPYFLIGIPSCTIIDSALFTVSTKAGKVGTASISFTEVDIIGEGVSAGTASKRGNYTIKDISVPVPKPATTPTSKPVSTSVVTPTQDSLPITLDTMDTQEEESDSMTVSQPEELDGMSFFAIIKRIVTFSKNETGNVWIDFFRRIAMQLWFR